VGKRKFKDPCIRETQSEIHTVEFQGEVPIESSSMIPKGERVTLMSLLVLLCQLKRGG
jgi:hypothetical protein